LFALFCGGVSLLPACFVASGAGRGAWWRPESTGQGETDDLDPAHGEDWPESRHIRASVIRCLAMGEIWSGYDAP
jgi:hypothetical protein